MKFIKYLTPFIWLFPFCIYLAFQTWSGHLTRYNLVPQRAILFVSIGFTMLIVDLFTKYLAGKKNLGYVWVVELVILAVFAIMIIPKVNEISAQ